MPVVPDVAGPVWAAASLKFLKASATMNGVLASEILQDTLKAELNKNLRTSQTARHAISSLGNVALLSSS